MIARSQVWPSLPPVAAWEDTYRTLHMWLQIVGKIRLELSPWINHSWGSALYLTSRGITTSPLHHQGAVFTIDFDFVDHALRIVTSQAPVRCVALRPMSVAGFYAQLRGELRELGLEVNISKQPVEVVEAIPFDQDETHHAYDGEAVQRVFGAFLQAGRVLTQFRTRFIGKASPVHFFWGSFDLAVTRFSGRTAPQHPGGAPHCADWIMQEAYSRELSSAGFWPGLGLGEAAFYSYAYPLQDGFVRAPVQPSEAHFHDSLGEFILPYEAVRRARDPDAALLSFLESTYMAAAQLGRWDRAALEWQPPSRT
jgi:hypothetical protein